MPQPGGMTHIEEIEGVTRWRLHLNILRYDIMRMQVQYTCPSNITDWPTKQSPVSGHKSA